MTPATQARNAAGLNLEEAARRARIHPRYLRQIEKGVVLPMFLRSD